MPDIKILPDGKAVAQAAADVIVPAARQAAAAGRNFSLVLSGGSTPKILYQLLAAEPARSQIDWNRFEVYFGDERVVPPDHNDSNFKMANEAMLSKAPIPPANVHRMKGEIDPQQAAKEYGELLKAKFGDGGPDVTLLGMGDDGHTASLFPGTSALKEEKHRVVAHYVENSTTGKSWRITTTAPFINRSKRILVMVTGASKAARLVEIFKGPRDTERLPIQLIAPSAGGKMTWLLDTAAAAQVTDLAK
jgi:6-phosphogluconolactonase